jgi:hypothetical protein
MIKSPIQIVVARVNRQRAVRIVDPQAENQYLQKK